MAINPSRSLYASSVLTEASQSLAQTPARTQRWLAVLEQEMFAQSGKKKEPEDNSAWAGSPQWQEPKLPYIFPVSEHRTQNAGSDESRGAGAAEMYHPDVASRPAQKLSLDGLGNAGTNAIRQANMQKTLGNLNNVVARSAEEARAVVVPNALSNWDDGIARFDNNGAIVAQNTLVKQSDDIVRSNDAAGATAIAQSHAALQMASLTQNSFSSNDFLSRNVEVGNAANSPLTQDFPIAASISGYGQTGQGISHVSNSANATGSMIQAMASQSDVTNPRISAQAVNFVAGVTQQVNATELVKGLQSTSVATNQMPGASKQGSLAEGFAAKSQMKGYGYWGSAGVSLNNDVGVAMRWLGEETLQASHDSQSETELQNNAKRSMFRALEGENYGKEHFHVYQDEHGVQAWLRDKLVDNQMVTALLLQNLQIQLGAVGGKLNALTINGRKLTLENQSGLIANGEDEYMSEQIGQSSDGRGAEYKRHNLHANEGGVV